MGKFGKRVNVATDLSKYMIGVMAPSGFGKTTLMYQVCEKEFGSDGYIILDMAQEDGVAALQGAVAEKVTTWKKMKEVVDDIVKNKATDYPDLKVVILDTLDAAFEAAEQYAVDTYNRENMGKQGFTKASSINGVEGGFGRGLEKVIEYVKKEIVRLNSVGVGVYWTAHVKEKDQVDLFTGTQYTTLTANMSMKYFNAIKNSSHIVAFGYFDRSIEKQAVGEVNPITKKAKERKSVLAEARKLKFRDDAMIADAKSRFSEITDEIDLDADLFIQAIKDAIEVERGKMNGTTTPKATKKATPAPVVVEPYDEEEDNDPPFDVDDMDDNLDSEVEVDFAALRTEIRNLNKSGTAEQKKQVKAIIASTGMKLDEIEDVSVLTQILEIFE
jgi:GTPase SAR1 family protein